MCLIKTEGEMLVSFLKTAENLPREENPASSASVAILYFL